MKRLLKTGIVFISIVVLLILLGMVLWRWFLKQAYPKTRGSIKLDGLTAPVEIVRDSYGVPHIYARNSEDLFFAQGYIHSQDRFWQMELWRRIGAGRLSEILGRKTLGIDIYVRTMGFERIARQEYALLDEETRRILHAYCAGVNSYILNRKPARLGLEFALLQLKGVRGEIEPWTPVNSLTWFKMMAEDLSFNKWAELYMVDLIRAVGYEMAKDFFPPYPDGELPSIISDKELLKNRYSYNQGSEDRETDDLLDHIAHLSGRLVGGFDPGEPLALGKGLNIGSNSWVVSGRRTTTGAPLLANDPHLSVQIPSVWYEIGLRTVQDNEEDISYNVRGFSFPGVPGVVVGHNERIAWGLTAFTADVQDFFIERINPYNPDQYEMNGRWLDMEIINEEIIVQGEAEPYDLQVRKTRHGPLLTDLEDLMDEANFTIHPQGKFPNSLELFALSLAWPALETNGTMKALLLVNRARSFDEFHKALRFFDSPAHNVVYADSEGNIGYQTTGLIPIRSKGNGMLPSPGWTDDYEWRGYIPYEELPNVYNPDKGYIVAANNAVVGDVYPYFFSCEFPGYRAKRIVEMIEADKDGISIDDTILIQSDTLNVSALELIPYLEDISFDELEIERARRELLSWDGRMETDSSFALLYGYFWIELANALFRDQMTENTLPVDRLSLSWSRMKLSLLSLLRDPSNAWWDDRKSSDIVEQRDDILKRAFGRAYRGCAGQHGKRPSKWRWGDAHTVTFVNQAFGQSGVSFIESIFNRGPYPARGGIQTVNTADWFFHEPFDVVLLSSMRQIIDLGDFSSSLMINATGQSGHPGHRHYDDCIDLWLKNEYHPTLWEREDLKADSSQRLVLIPSERE